MILFYRFCDVNGHFRCWLNFGHPICFGTFVPVIFCTCTAAVVLESAGQRLNRNFAFGNSAQVTSAKLVGEALNYLFCQVSHSCFFQDKPKKLVSNDTITNNYLVFGTVCCILSKYWLIFYSIRLTHRTWLCSRIFSHFGKC